MQPTIGDELAGARRCLSALQAAPDMPPDLAADMELVIQTLRRVERVWTQALPFLMTDNARIETLLGRLLPLLSSEVPVEVRARIEGLLAEMQLPEEGTTLDIMAINERNEALRAVLSRLITASPMFAAAASEANDRSTVRSIVIDCLREGLDGRPF